MRTQKRKRIPRGFVASSTSNLAGYGGYFISLHEEFEQEEPVLLLSEPEVYDHHEVDLNQLNDLICGLPFHRGRGDLIRDVKAGILKASSNIHSVGDGFLKKVNIESRVQKTLQCSNGFLYYVLHLKLEQYFCSFSFGGNFVWEL